MSTIKEQPAVVDLNATPDETWSLEQLGEYCRVADCKIAVHRWRIGKALLIAKDKHGPHGKWGAWLKRYCTHWSRPSITRYMKLAKSITQERLNGVGLTEAYRMLGIIGRVGTSSGRAGEATSSKEAAQQRNRMKSSSAKRDSKCNQKNGSGEDGTKHGSPSTEVSTGSVKIVKPQEEASDEEDVENELTPEEELREALADLPYLLRGFRDSIAGIRAHDKALRDACWQHIQPQQETIRKQITMLRDDLLWLQEDMPQVAALARA